MWLILNPHFGYIKSILIFNIIAFNKHEPYKRICEIGQPLIEIRNLKSSHLHIVISSHHFILHVLQHINTHPLRIHPITRSYIYAEGTVYIVYLPIIFRPNRNYSIIAFAS